MGVELDATELRGFDRLRVFDPHVFAVNGAQPVVPTAPERRILGEKVGFRLSLDFGTVDSRREKRAKPGSRSRVPMRAAPTSGARSIRSMRDRPRLNLEQGSSACDDSVSHSHFSHFFPTTPFPHRAREVAARATGRNFSMAVGARSTGKVTTATDPSADGRVNRSTEPPSATTAMANRRRRAKVARVRARSATWSPVKTRTSPTHADSRASSGSGASSSTTTWTRRRWPIRPFRSTSRFRSATPFSIPMDPGSRGFRSTARSKNSSMESPNRSTS